MISVRTQKIFVIFTLFTILFSTVFIMAPSITMAQNSQPALAHDNDAPDFETQDLNGTTITLHSFKGQKPVLLYFWASWCPYCMAVRPAVINLRNEIDPKDLEIIAVNAGGGDSLAKVKRFQEVHPAPYTVVYDGDSKVVQRAYSVTGIPHFVLIDKNGSVKYRGSGLPPDPMALLKK
jgi:thiol-disulfide isomerase/thioredoxin